MIIFKYAEEIYNRHLSEQRIQGVLQDVSHLKLNKVSEEKVLNNSKNI